MGLLHPPPPVGHDLVLLGLPLEADVVVGTGVDDHLGRLTVAGPTADLEVLALLKLAVQIAQGLHEVLLLADLRADTLEMGHNSAPFKYVRLFSLTRAWTGSGWKA